MYVSSNNMKQTNGWRRGEERERGKEVRIFVALKDGNDECATTVYALA